MPTFHVTAVPIEGEARNPEFPPLVKLDFTADHEADALGQAQAIINYDGGFQAELREMAAAGTRGRKRYADWGIGWRLVAQQVDRPTVDLERDPERRQIYRGGKLVGMDNGYGDKNVSFFILLDEVRHGRLVRAYLPAGAKDVPELREWEIEDPSGPIAHLAGRRWPHVDEPPYPYPWAALRDIRSELVARAPQG